ncbi:MAG: hypothetical protein HN712_27980 [Gemmatimonadetes bacterium]|nr:hypothetical protein [Gemmatimonadota bacterium]MBT6149172.1 hypothetical protein [Gemmatimonadota bacterium]MBT7864182.1 hypothetical protein [Gemmatimonadota bacterium]
MPGRLAIHLSQLALVWFASGCIGTDYIADPPMRVPARVEISPSMAALQIGEQIDLRVVFYDEYGEPDSTLTIEYVSGRPEVALTALDGTIQGLSLGQAAITVSVSDADSILAQATALVTVVEDPTTQLALVRVAPESTSLSIGDTVRFQATSHNATGGELASEGYSWDSSDGAVITVDTAGVGVARGGGTAQVRATTAGIRSAGIEISVLGTHLRGAFFSRGGYNCEGTAILSPDDEDQLVLNFLEDFVIDQGPRLEVFLSPVDQVAPGSINLGELKALRGEQFYDLPADTQLGDYGWVIIHCVPFNVSFGLAELE